jgi:hypothetical protein
MGRRGTLIAGALVVLALVLVPPAAAHGNAVALDAQRSTNGTIQVEGVRSLTDGWLVVHADDGGEPGAVIGHRFVSGGTELRTDVRVAIDEAVWADWNGTRTVHVLLHNDDGDDAFDSASDPVITTSGNRAGATIQLGQASAPAMVAAQRDHTPTTTGNATVRQVDMPTDGRLVLTSEGPGSRVLARRSLAAGAHENVTLELNRSFYRFQGADFSVTAVLYRGTNPAPLDETTVIRAGDRPVATTFELAPANATTPTPTAGPSTTSPGAGTTATPADSMGNGSAGAETTADPATDDPPSPTGATGPGFDAVVALLAILFAVFVLSRRRAA